MRILRYLFLLLFLCVSTIAAEAQNTCGFNSDNPSDPATPDNSPVDGAYQLTLTATDGGSVKSGSGKYDAGIEVQVTANAAAANFVFDSWVDESGNELSRQLSFKYIMPERNVHLTARYNFDSSNPSDPSVPDIIEPEENLDGAVRILSVVTEEGGVVLVNGRNVPSSHTREVHEGTVVVLSVSVAENFVFSGWYSNGTVYSKDRTLSFVMGSENLTLTAHFDFVPGSPAEPAPSVTKTCGLYFKSTKGFAGDSIGCVLYINNNCTIHDITFNVKFPVKPEMADAILSEAAKGYTYTFERISPSNLARSASTNSLIGNLYDSTTYKVTLTGSIVQPGNHPLMVFPLKIYSTGLQNVKLAHASMTLDDGSEINGILRDGVIDVDQKDKYSWFKNLTKVGNDRYDLYQALQVKRRIPVEYNLPMDSIADLLGCSSTSSIVFKAPDGNGKISNDYSADNGFWIGNQIIVGECPENDETLRLCVQCWPESKKFSIMQYPGKYNDGVVSNFVVYFTYEDKYYSALIYLHIQGQDTLLVQRQKLVDCKERLSKARKELNDAYKETSSTFLYSQFNVCVSYISGIDDLIKQIDDYTESADESGDVFNKIFEDSDERIKESDKFIVSLGQIISDYLAAYNTLATSLSGLSDAIGQYGKQVHPSVYKEVNAKYFDAKQKLTDGVLSDKEAISLAAELDAKATELPTQVQIEYVVGEMEQAGELSQHIAQASKVTHLVLSGPLNGTDIKYIRNTLYGLTDIDLQNAWIVAGGEAYQYSGVDYKTDDFKVGDYMFAGMPNLERLTLSDSVQSIGKSIISGSNNILEIAIPKETQTVASQALEGVNPHIRAEWNSTQARVPENLFGYTGPLLYAVAGTKCALDANGKEMLLPNIVIDGVADLVVLEGNEECGVYIPESFRAKEVRYTRNFSRENVYHQSSGWETLVLPFDVQTIVSEKVGEIAPFMRDSKYEHQFWLATLTENGFKSQASIKANVPYIISMPNSDMYFEETRINGNITFKAADEAGVEVYQNIELDAAESSIYAFNPVYDREMKAENVYALNEEPFNVTDIVDEEEVIRTMAVGSAFVKNKYDVRPFESYMSALTTAGNSRSYIAIGDNESLTAIDDILEDAATSATRGVEGIFDLRGNRVQQSDMVPGNVYIINGVKIKFE